MEKEKILTAREEEFYRYLKKELFLSGIRVRFKQSLWDICSQNPVPMPYGNEAGLLKQIDIDFVLYRKDRLIAGIEILDEASELDENLGEKTLIDFNFKRINARCFVIMGTDDLKKAAKFIKEKISSS